MATAYFKKREIRVAQEGSWMENASSLSSISWTVGATILRLKAWEIDTSGLVVTGVDDQATLTDLRARLGKLTTVRSNSKLSFKHYLTGLGDAATGAAGTTELGTLLSWSLGNESKSTGTTVTGVGSTTTTVDCTSAAGIAAGQFVIVNKELRRVISKSSNTITLHHALSAAPVATDVVYGASAYYPAEAVPTAALRFAILGDTNAAADQITAVGCHLEGFELGGMNPGEEPWIKLVFNVAYWDLAAYSLTVTTTAFLDKTCAAVGGAGMFYNQTGTTTRNVLQETGFKITPSFGLVKDPSSAGSGTGNIGDIQGWVRGDCSAKGSFVTAFDSAFFTNWATNTTTGWNILRQNCPTPGKVTGIYLPLVYPDAEPKRMSIGDKTGWEVPFFTARGADTALTSDLGYLPYAIVLG